MAGGMVHVDPKADVPADGSCPFVAPWRVEVIMPKTLRYLVIRGIAVGLLAISGVPLWGHSVAGARIARGVTELSGTALVGAQFTTQTESSALHTAVTDVNGVYRSFTQGNVLFSRYRQEYIGTHPKESFRVNSQFHLIYGARWEPLLPAVATHNHGGSDLRIAPAILRQHLRMIVSSSLASAPAGDSILYHHHSSLRCIFNELAWTLPPSEFAQGHPSSKWAVTCKPGKAVERKADGSHDALFTATLQLRQGVTLLVDKGAILFGSRNPRNYDLGPGGVTAIRFSALTIDWADRSARRMRISNLTDHGAVSVSHVVKM